MKILLQRALNAAVTVEGGPSAGAAEGRETVGKIDHGLLLLVCAEPDDHDADRQMLARKVAAMRIFEDENGKMNRSLRDVEGDVLAVSQFTLAARWKSGNRPGFSDAAAPDDARHGFDSFCDLLRAEGLHVETGRFGAAMQVQLINDGPVTIWLDSKNPR